MSKRKTNASFQNREKNPTNPADLPDLDDDPSALREPSGQESVRKSNRGAVVYNAPYSPQWSSTTKIIIGLTLAAVGVFLVFRFLNILGPLLVTFILAYLFYPMAESIHRYLRLPWRVSVTLIYLLVVLLLLGSLTAGGVAIFENVQGLITFLENAIKDLPGTVETLITTPVQIGPFVFQPNALDLDIETLTSQVLGVVQPLLSGAGSVVGTFASSAAVVVGWTFLILLISYFILSESGGGPNLITNINLPGYSHDMQRLSIELGRIWNAFLRGQLTIVLVTILVYMFLLGVLGVKFFFGLALLAGIARFIPYVGPAIAWTTYGLVTFFQGSTLFGMPPLGYMALVVITAWVIDMIMDNVVAPRLMADALRVHPAAVMVSALVAANLLGVIGMVLAAPVLATVQLFLGYVTRKMLDQDPWTGMQTISPPGSMDTLMPEVQKRANDAIEWITRFRLPRQK